MISLSSSCRIKGKSVKAMCPIPFKSPKRLPSLFFSELLNNQERASQFPSKFTLNISEVIEQWGCFSMIVLLAISSLMGVNHGSKVRTFFSLSSFSAMPIAVVAPKPCPAIVRSSLSMINVSQLKRFLLIESISSIKLCISLVLTPSLVMILF